MESELATNLGTVITQLTAAAGDVAPKVAVSAGIGIGVGLLVFGIRMVYRVFKGTAK
jgi:hypothetical protein